jgi:Zn-finger nucleic acid-binding protein
MRLKPDNVSFQCDYCHTSFLPEANADDGVRVLGEPSGQDCPICSTGLTHATLSNIRICYCTKCRGMLVPMGALQSLVDELQAQKRGATVQPAADTSDLRRKINCPQCHHPMDAHFYAGPGHVIIDSCENCCIIWLDGGGLMRIVQAPERQFDTTETLLTSPTMDSAIDSALTRGIATNLAVDVASDIVFNVVDSLFNE